MAKKRMDALIDQAVMDSFPASDPPSYMGGAAILGAPSHSGFVREPALTEILAVDEPRSANRQWHDR